MRYQGVLGGESRLDLAFYQKRLEKEGFEYHGTTEIDREFWKEKLLNIKAL